MSDSKNFKESVKEFFSPKNLKTLFLLYPKASNDEDTKSKDEDTKNKVVKINDLTFKDTDLKKNGLLKTLNEKYSIEDSKLIVEGLRHEYTEICNSNRHYSNLRFAILTVCFAIMGGLLKILFDSPLCSTNPKIVSLKVVGIVTALIFGIFELYCLNYILTFIENAKDLESKLGYKQFENRENKILKTKYLKFANVGIYIVLIIFWVFQLFFSS
jgi:hypothetical protein